MLFVYEWYKTSKLSVSVMWVLSGSPVNSQPWNAQPGKTQPGKHSQDCTARDYDAKWHWIPWLYIPDLCVRLRSPYCTTRCDTTMENDAKMYMNSRAVHSRGVFGFTQGVLYSQNLDAKNHASFTDASTASKLHYPNWFYNQHRWYNFIEEFCCASPKTKITLGLVRLKRSKTRNVGGLY